MSVEELKAAVSHLTTDELERFSQWFEEFLADEDFEAGRCTPLVP